MARIVDWESRIGRRLRLRDLHVFFAVVQSGSMAKAATQLRVTQPSVSKAIGDLEAALSVRLFDRSSQGVEPTLYGQALIKCGAAVFDELKQGIRHIEFLADPTSGELRIGCLAAITATMIIPTIIERFGQAHSRVILHVDDESSHRSLLSGLRDRKYDLTIVRVGSPLAGDLNDINIEVLFHDRMVVVAGIHSKWASRRRIDLAELVAGPWILSAPDTWIYTRLAEAFQERGLAVPTARLVTLSVPLRTHLLASGQYLAPFGHAALSLLNAARPIVKALPIDLPDRPWPVAIMTLKDRTLSPVAERFIGCARQVAISLAGKSRAHPTGPNVA